MKLKHLIGIALYTIIMTDFSFAMEHRPATFSHAIIASHSKYISNYKRHVPHKHEDLEEGEIVSDSSSEEELESEKWTPLKTEKMSIDFAPNTTPIVFKATYLSTRIMAQKTKAFQVINTKTKTLDEKKADIMKIISEFYTDTEPGKIKPRKIKPDLITHISPSEKTQLDILYAYASTDVNIIRHINIKHASHFNL